MVGVSLCAPFRLPRAQEPNFPSVVDILPMNPQHLDIDLGPDRSRTHCLTWPCSVLLRPYCIRSSVRESDMKLVSERKTRPLRIRSTD